ncbi:MAG TPA: serine/threonine-protein kinase, partial [Polyangiaceae bacterium]|nr:serine/threonine-protein kinase [Polyangiaceae bacterium]
MSLSSPSAPFSIGRYAFHGEIASGGMATVHFARLLGPGGFSRIVAAKRLLSHLVKDQEFTAMLMDEARLAARIRHPNVVSTLDVVSTGDELLVVMDYVHGESVAKLSRTAADLGEPIPHSIAAAIVIDALRGLHAAHEVKDESGELLGVVHRDVSPHNLLVGVDGVTRVADFGIAMAAGRSHQTRDGAVKGKLSYMAPEQIERGDLTAATDVFAISVVLWELLAGQRLWSGNNDGAIVHEVLNAPAPSLRDLRPDLPPAYDAIVQRGLAKDPAARFQSARDMALELEAAAPPVRASEVGAWVERIASDTLVRRSRTIAKIERTEASED